MKDKKKQTLLKTLEHASKDYGQFHFCQSYYSRHAPDRCEVAHHPENLHKNKENFWGFPFDSNLITSIPGYINASPMRFGKHYYIAAQGPRKNTFDEFWQMVFSEKVDLIISLTNETEERKGKQQMKFERFWPTSGSMKYGTVNVTLISDELIEEWNDGRLEKIRRRDFTLSKGGKTREITHLHMENWPDSGVIHPESLFTLTQVVDQLKKKGAMVVHCAAGVGRTGTFIAFHSLYHDLLEHLSDESTIELNVTARVAEMRKLRWGAMVAEVEQYQLLINALHLALDSHFQP